MKSIDRQFKDTFSQWEVPPDAAIWPRVAAHLPPRQTKRRRMAWWFLSLAGLGLIVFILYRSLTSETAVLSKTASATYDEPSAAPLLTESSLVQTQTFTPASSRVNPAIPPPTHPSRPAATSGSSAPAKHSSSFLQDGQKQALSAVPLAVIPAKEELATPELTSPLIQSTGLGKEVQLLPDAATTLSSPDPDCPGFEKNRSLNRAGQWQIDVFGGPGYALKRLSAKTAEGVSYLNARKREEHAIMAYMAGARAGYYLPISNGKAIGLKTGLDFSKIVEKLAYSRDSVLGSVTTIVIDSQFINGGWVINRDTVTSQRLGRLDRTFYNRFTLLEIPFLLSFQWDKGPWLWQLNGGATFQLAYRKKGYILDPADQLTDLNDNTGNTYFNPGWGTQIWASLGLHRQLAPRWYVFAEPTVRYQLKSMTTPANLLNQQYIQLHLNFGTKIIF